MMLLSNLIIDIWLSLMRLVLILVFLSTKRIQLQVYGKLTPINSLQEMPSKTLLSVMILVFLGSQLLPTALIKAR